MTDQMDRTREQILLLQQALHDDADPAVIDALVEDLHPADLAELLDMLPDDDRVALFNRLSTTLQAETLSEVEEEVVPVLLDSVEKIDVRGLFDELEVDDAADILGELPDEDARLILDRIEPSESREIAALMEYDEESAGGVMTTDFVSVPVGLTADEAIAQVRRLGREIRDFYAVYVVDEQRRLVGRVELRDLMVAADTTPVGDFMATEIVSVGPEVDQEEVARLIAKYNLVVMPVIDRYGRLLGRITVDDVIDIIEAETTEDIFRLSGVHEEETHATPLEIVRSRIPWLLITLGTSGLGAMVVAQFEATIQRVAFIAVFMPVVAAMAGNSAVQATAVTVRRLALSGDPVRPLRSVLRELSAGLIIGLAIALIVGVVAAVWRDDTSIGLVVGGSMWVSISIGVLWGASFPLVLNRFGLDPAVSSSVFLSTMTDLISFLLILGSASYFLVRWL